MTKTLIKCHENGNVNKNKLGTQMPENITKLFEFKTSTTRSGLTLKTKTTGQTDKYYRDCFSTGKTEILKQSTTIRTRLNQIKNRYIDSYYEKCDLDNCYICLKKKLRAH